MAMNSRVQVPAVAKRGEAIEIQFSGLACLRIPPSTPPGLAAAVVQELVRR